MVDLTVAPELVDFDGFINYGTPIFLPLVSQEKGRMKVTMTKASDNFILQPVFSKRSISSVRVITGRPWRSSEPLKKLPQNPIWTKFHFGGYP